MKDRSNCLNKKDGEELYVGYVPLRSVKGSLGSRVSNKYLAVIILNIWIICYETIFFKPKLVKLKINCPLTSTVQINLLWIRVYIYFKLTICLTQQLRMYVISGSPDRKVFYFKLILKLAVDSQTLLKKIHLFEYFKTNSILKLFRGLDFTRQSLESFTTSLSFLRFYWLTQELKRHAKHQLLES